MSSEPQRHKSPEELAALRAEKFSHRLDFPPLLESILSTQRPLETNSVHESPTHEVDAKSEFFPPSHFSEWRPTADQDDAVDDQRPDLNSCWETKKDQQVEQNSTCSVAAASIFSRTEFSATIPEQPIANSVLVEELLVQSVSDYADTFAETSQELGEQMPSSKFDTPESAGSFSSILADAVPLVRAVLPPRRSPKIPISSEESVDVVETDGIAMHQGIPARKHSAQELQQMRQRGLLETRPPVRHVLSMQLHPITTTLCYLIALSVIIFSIRGWSHEGTERLLTPSYGCSALLILSLLIYWKKPRARHHAAFLTAIAVIVMGFVILYTFKNPYAA